ncbi:MAG: hypothetical protein WAK28_09705 [Trebonia sp.]
MQLALGGGRQQPLGAPVLRLSAADPPAATAAPVPEFVDVSLVASRMRWARSQASSSVGPRIGRKLTLIRGGVSRPAFFAASFTESICSFVSASGSPHSA